MPGLPAMFLDRDGVIIENAHYLARLEDVQLIAGAAAAIRRLNLAGIPTFVVTNQSGVARGYFPETFVRATHDHLDQCLAEQGAHIDGWYFCPHHPEAGEGEFRRDCDCRKPNPGMLLEAARQHSLDLKRSWLIGDNLTDCEAGVAAGCQTILVRTGHGKEMEMMTRGSSTPFVTIADSLADAVAWFLENHSIREAA